MPCIRLIDPSENMMKYVYSGAIADMTVDSVRSYVADFKGGKLEPHLKSEEIPEGNIKQHITLVGKQYEEIVKDPTKDVLVKYYAPWCGHCKALAPVWEELAQDVADIEDLLIVKYDATANENAGVEIRGYPTLKYYPKDNKAGVDYSGDRELADFKKWLSENSSAYQAARATDSAAGGAEGEAHVEL